MTPCRGLGLLAGRAGYLERRKYFPCPHARTRARGAVHRAGQEITGSADGSGRVRKRAAAAARMRFCAFVPLSVATGGAACCRWNGRVLRGGPRPGWCVAVRPSASRRTRKRRQRVRAHLAARAPFACTLARNAEANGRGSVRLFHCWPRLAARCKAPKNVPVPVILRMCPFQCCVARAHAVLHARMGVIGMAARIVRQEAPAQALPVPTLSHKLGARRLRARGISRDARACAHVHIHVCMHTCASAHARGQHHTPWYGNANVLECESAGARSDPTRRRCDAGAAYRAQPTR